MLRQLVFIFKQIKNTETYGICSIHLQKINIFVRFYILRGYEENLSYGISFRVAQ
jgi:hypothetical protein